MPTGWRPKDIKLKFPLHIIEDPYKQKKYHTNLSTSLTIWSFFQQFIGMVFMFHFFYILHQQDPITNYFYGIFIIIHIFSFTSAMDQNKYSIIAELIKLFFSISLIYTYSFTWFGLKGINIYLIIFYLIISLLITTYFFSKNKINLKPS